jgi:hypothetical protein
MRIKASASICASVFPNQMENVDAQHRFGRSYRENIANLHELLSGEAGIFCQFNFGILGL